MLTLVSSRDSVPGDPILTTAASDRRIWRRRRQATVFAQLLRCPLRMRSGAARPRGVPRPGGSGRHERRLLVARPGGAAGRGAVLHILRCLRLRSLSHDRLHAAIANVLVSAAQPCRLRDDSHSWHPDTSACGSPDSLQCFHSLTQGLIGNKCDHFPWRSRTGDASRAAPLPVSAGRAVVAGPAAQRDVVGVLAAERCPGLAGSSRSPGPA